MTLYIRLDYSPMVPILILTLLLTATGAMGNLMAGKYQAFFFYYQVYLLEIEAHSLANCHLAPSAPKTAFPAILRSS